MAGYSADEIAGMTTADGRVTADCQFCSAHYEFDPDAPSSENGLMTADDVAAMGGREEDWNRAVMLMQTAETHELIGPHLAMEELLYRLFHEERPMAYPAQAVEFGCTCSAGKVEAALAQYSAGDIAGMTTGDGRVTADCQFCSAHYEFDPEALGFEATKNLDGSARE